MKAKTGKTYQCDQGTIDAPVRRSSLIQHVTLVERRPGALDYRSIPSLMAGERVAYVKSDDDSNASF
jgi:hypothetical protein